MALILICLSEPNAATASTALAGTKHSVIQIKPLNPDDGLEKAISAILEHKPNVVLMDYWAEDAASVKLMQVVSEKDGRPEFIFVETSPGEINLDQALMAVNEGAKALLTCNFNPKSLVNYIERAASGPGRFRLDLSHQSNSNDDADHLEEQLGQLRSRTTAYQTLIGYLLATPVSAQNRTTLLVSDSSYQLELLKKMLTEHNMPVLTASNPNDGLKIALSERPRIIVSDLELEGQSGVEFCQAVKLTNKIVPCHFIICTANQDRISIVMTPGNGVDDCIIKPSGQNDMKDFIARVALGLLL